MKTAFLCKLKLLSGPFIFILLVISGTTWVPLRAQELWQLSTYDRITTPPALPTFRPSDTARIMKMMAAGKKLGDSQPDSALNLFRIVMKESLRLGFTDGIASALYYTGNIQSRAGKMENALQSYRSALPYCRRAYYDKRLVHAVYHNLGTVHADMGQYNVAIRYYDSAVREATRSLLPDHPLALAMSYMNMGVLYEKIAQHTIALSYFEKAEQIYRSKDHPEGLAVALLNKRNSYLKLGRPEDAGKCIPEKLSIPERNLVNDSQYGIFTYATMVLLMREQEQPKKAVLYLKAMEQFVNARFSLYASTRPYIFIGENYMLLGASRKAEHYLELAVQQAHKLGLESFEMQATLSLAKLYEQTGRPALALEQLTNYIKVKDNILTKEKIKDVSELEIRYRTAEKDKLIAQAQRDAARKNFFIAAIATGAIILLAIFFIFYRLARQKQKMLQQEKEIGQLRNIMKGEEKERGRIARELHDGIGGMLGAIKMQASRIRNNPEPGKFNDLMRMIDDTANEVRQTSHNLLPDILERHTLEEALTLYCVSIHKNTDLNVDVQFHGLTGDLPKSAKLIIYRIVQELVQNILKHAHATIADVQITRKGNVLNIIVEDNGIGFDTNDTAKGIGMFNMEYRVQAMNGYMAVDSIKGKSTTIFIEFDLEKLKSEVEQ